VLYSTRSVGQLLVLQPVSSKNITSFKLRFERLDEWTLATSSLQPSRDLRSMTIVCLEPLIEIKVKYVVASQCVSE